MSIIKKNTLHNIPLFSRLAEKDIELLHRIANKKAFPKNVILAHEGEPLERFCILLSGSVKEYLSDINGKEITLGILKQSEYFGELSLLGHTTQSASIVTTENVLLVSFL